MPNAAARADAGSLPQAMSYPACDLMSLSNELAECDAFLSVCPEQDEGRLQRLLDQHCSLLVKINRISTRTLADLKIKVAVADLAFKWDDNASSEGEGSFVELCKSVNRDILGMDARD